MFCSNCGKENLKGSNFCIHCGSILQKIFSDIEATSTANTLKKQPNILPIFDNPISKWTKTKFDIRSETIPDELKWILHEVDLLITPQGTLVISAKPLTKTGEVTEKIALGAVAVGAVAGLAVAIPVGIIGAAYEKIYGHSNSLNRTSLEIVFESNLLVWVPHTSVKYRCFNVNGGLFGSLGTIGVISGTFQYNNGIFNMSISQNDFGWGKLSQVKKAFSNNILNSKQYEFKNNDDVNKILDREYPLYQGFDVKVMRKAISGK